MRVFHLTVLAAAMTASPAIAAGEASTAHLEHVAHSGMGQPVGAAAQGELPRAPAAKPGAAKARPDARKIAVRAGYKPVAELTNGAFPPFYPGIGSVYVRPKTLPVGPFLAFDHKGRQVSTIYMLSLEEMNAHKKFEATGTRVPSTNHVTVYHHGGHPGVDFPHYHYVLWHVTKKDEERVAR